MTHEIDNSDLLVRRYLLGGLTPPQREQIERRVFTDPEYRERVELIEEELVDEFVDERLSEEERGAFAAHLRANPNLRLDVGIVKELKRHAAARSHAPAGAAAEAPAEPEPEPRLFAGWLAALRPFQTHLAVTSVVLLAILAGVLLWRGLEARRLEQELLYARSRSEKVEREVARLNAAGDEAAARAALAAMASPSTHAELQPGVSRNARDGAAYPSLSPPSGAAYARLRLKLEPAADFQSYHARFKSVDDGLSFEADLRPTLEEGRPGLWVTLPLGVLPNGDYQVELSGRLAAGPPVELPNHYYYFRIAGR